MSVDVERLRALKNLHGEVLRRRFGAHGVGIGRKRVGGRKTDEICLVFYVSEKQPAGALGERAIPARLVLELEGTGDVEVTTDVVEAPAAEFE